MPSVNTLAHIKCVIRFNPMSFVLDDDVKTLIALFDRTFADSERTCLVAGVDEPIYLPSTDDQPLSRIEFAHGYFASALHEIAHWCIAGKERRTRVDYGYWYEPDGRSAEQQVLFQRVEVKPQAIEWLFTWACKRTFRVSVDNLNADISSEDMAAQTHQFKQAVYEQACIYIDQGLPARAQVFMAVLLHYHGRPAPVLSDVCFADL